MSCGRFEDSSVEGGTGDAEAGGDLGYRYVGGFEQGADGLDLFGRQFYRAATLAATGTSGSKASNGSFADEVAFELRLLRRTAIGR